MSETRSVDVESDVLRFLEELPKQKRMLSSPVPEDRQLNVYRLRSEWAQAMLTAPQFAEAIQLLNERVMNSIYETDPTDGARLAVLHAKLHVITEFCEELQIMVDRWMEVQQIQEQHNRRQLHGDSDPYDRYQTENVL